jgi:GMP reductase
MPIIETEVKLDFKDVLIRPKRSSLASRSQVSIERTFTFPNSKQTWTGVPIIAANMDTVGTFEVAEVLAKKKCMTAMHKHYTVEEWKTWASGSGKEALPYVAASVGILEKDMQKLKEILTAVPEVKLICVDVANGYSEAFVACIRKVRKEYPEHTIIAGNVVTKEMTEELIFSGADIVKVGIGPGSVCTTRKQTGVGYPQLSAVLECADAAHGLGGRIISDGGCTCPGDVAKAFGGGSDFVMLGGMLAGHEECAGETVEVNGEYFKVFYGMSSDTAMKKHAGGVAEYRSSEGKTVKVPYRGPVDETIRDILGGLRSACTYVGAAELRELSKRTTFIRVTQQLNTVFTESTKVNPVKMEPPTKKAKTEAA